MKEIIRYSEAFKKEIVRELENGSGRNVTELSRRYGIKGAETVKRWVRQYGREGLLRPVIKVQKKDEVDELKRLRRRIEKLESALADAHIKNLVNESYLDLACERLSEPVEKFKKKHAMRSWGGQRRKDKK